MALVIVLNNVQLTALFVMKIKIVYHVYLGTIKQKILVKNVPKNVFHAINQILLNAYYVIKPNKTDLL